APSFFTTPICSAPFVVVGRHGNRKWVRQYGPIQINAKRCKNLTGFRFGVLQALADVPLDTIADAVVAQLCLARKRLILRLGHWKPDAMTVARSPQLAHGGAFTALVEDGRVVGCEPFARDPAPSNMLDAIPEMVHSPLRIARPAIRDG